MTDAIVFFALAGVLIVVSTVLLEREVGDDGTVGRSLVARILTIAIAALTVGAAIATVTRLFDLAYVM